MPTATVEKQPALAGLPPSTSVTSPPRPAAKAATLLIGLDLGTNKSCVLAGSPGSSDITVSKVVPSVVGYVRDGIVDGIITGNAQILFGAVSYTHLASLPERAPGLRVRRGQRASKTRGTVCS